MEEGSCEGGVAVNALSRSFKLSFAMLKCVYSAMTISVYRSRALFQCILLGFWGVGGVWRAGSVLATLTLLGYWILMVLELLGGKFISPIMLLET